jgi:hypothetical protein
MSAVRNPFFGGNPGIHVFATASNGLPEVPTLPDHRMCFSTLSGQAGEGHVSLKLRMGIASFPADHQFELRSHCARQNEWLQPRQFGLLPV